MLFNSFAFAIFLLVVLAVYPWLSRNWQNRWLLVASYTFYSFWSWRYAVLLLATSLMDFGVSHAIARTSSASRKRAWLACAMSLNLGVLFAFKYFDFFVSEAANALGSLGLSVHPSFLRLGLPIGVSFLTFQEMGYTIDVYRGEMKPASSLRDYLLFVAYFPHLVAGPIQRSAHLLKQLEQPRAVRPDQIESGFVLLLTGLFRKTVVADSLAPYVDYVYANTEHASGKSLAAATLLFAFQIYCDFAGYSEMAVGMSRLMGIELIYNFKSPYLATNLREFWRRWHVSLSTWFRDYLFIPLGGNRRGLRIELRNVLIVFLVSGLWHGANWTFVVWGLVHGSCLSLQRLVLDRMPSRRFLRALGWPVTFVIVVVAWIFFRSSSVHQAAVVLRGLTRGGALYRSPPVVSGLIGLAMMIAAEIAARGKPLDQWLRARGQVWQLGAGLGLLFSIVLLGVRAGAQFIYFQF